MGYFPVRYDSRVVNYDHRGFIRLATGLDPRPQKKGFSPSKSFSNATSKCSNLNPKLFCKRSFKVSYKVKAINVL